MSRLHFIHAGPTPWDLEDRVVGDHPLPLTDQARRTIEDLAKTLPNAVSAVYRFKKNEACEQAARIVATALKLRSSENSALNEVNLGLWQGLKRSELKFRFPTVFPQWEENPLAVNPPEGEPLGDAIDRLRGGIKRILKRSRGSGIVLLLRPMAIQIALGLLHGEAPHAIAGHLHKTAAIETIELSDEQVQQFNSR